jgi:hypothetical protein
MTLTATAVSATRRKCRRLLSLVVAVLGEAPTMAFVGTFSIMMPRNSQDSGGGICRIKVPDLQESDRFMSGTYDLITFVFAYS